MTVIPAWLVADDEPIDWPMRSVSDDGALFGAAVPAFWSEPRYSAAGQQSTTAFAGPAPGEGLTVTLLRGAERDADIATWLRLPMAATGGLDPQTLPEPGTTSLLDWAEEADSDLATSLGVEVARAFTGLAAFTAVGTDRPRH